MRQRSLTLGLIFIFVGIAGLFSTYLYFEYTMVPLTRRTPFGKGLNKRQEEGKLIYYFGINAEGRRIPFKVEGMHPRMRSGMKMGCVKCHGRDGKGGLRFGWVKSPDIRWRALEKKGYNFYKFSNAVRKGRDEEGDNFNQIMPRWRMRAQELISLKAYLKTL